MTPDIKQALIGNGVVSEKQYGQAEEYAVQQGVSVEKALDALNIVNYLRLGQFLSAYHQLPYVPLAGCKVTAVMHSAISKDCAQRWKVFPVSHDPRASILTFAVATPDHAARIERIYHLLLETCDIAFTICPEPEIEEALVEQFPEETSVSSRSDSAGPEAAESLYGGRAVSPTRATRSDPLRRALDRKAEEQSGDRKPEHMTEELARSLVSSVSLLVTGHLGNDTKAVKRVRERARYCQLMAARLALSEHKRIRLILAAWVSGLEQKRSAVRQLVTPYDLEKILDAESSASPQETESQILTLVRCYQTFEAESADESRNVNLVRRHLLVHWASAGAHQDVLETFLQVLMDEQFLGRFDQSAGTILLFDPAAEVAPEIEPPLGKSGYRVHVVSDTPAALRSAHDAAPDLVIVYASSAAEEVLGFCKELNRNEKTAVPLIVLLGENSSIRGAEFLRAGAGDFMNTPLDLEVLYLKIEKQLSASARTSDKRHGVTGSLEDMSFSDMIQVLSASSKSMEITVENADEDRTGRIILRDGNVIHAELGDFVGEKAFYALMRWHKGEFSMLECSEFPDATITTSTMGLLMEGARLADENIEL